MQMFDSYTNIILIILYQVYSLENQRKSSRVNRHSIWPAQPLFILKIALYHSLIADLSFLSTVVKGVDFPWDTVNVVHGRLLLVPDHSVRHADVTELLGHNTCEMQVTSLKKTMVYGLKVMHG